MSHSAAIQASILIASDSLAEATLVKTLIDDDFENVAVSVDSNAAAECFHSHRPDILLLAFKDLPKSEEYYLSLYRLGGKIPQRQHRAVILCTKETVKLAYEQCRRGLFDDYVLFWPVTYDVTRLKMSIYCALDKLAMPPNANELVATCSAQTKRLLELEALFSEQLVRAEGHIASTECVIAGAGRDIGRVLGGLSERIARAGSSELDRLEGRAEMAREIDRCTSESVLPPLHKVSESLALLTQWTGDVRQSAAPYLESARAFNALAARAPSMVLVVDDDGFQRKVTTRILESAGYAVKCAANGMEAIRFVEGAGADLILMDLLMPDMDGLEATRRLKADPRLARIPIIMVTGNSERAIVLRSLELGIVDFIAKPFDRSALLAKIARAFAKRETAKSV